MISIVGIVVVLGAVLTGFTMTGGHVGALIHPSELVTIGGAALGALIVMSPKRVLVDLIRGVLLAIKGSPYTRECCNELLGLLFQLARMARRDGLLALEKHVSDPANSEVFRQFSRVSGNHHLTEFVCRALGRAAEGSIEAGQLEKELEEEIAVMEREHHQAVSALIRVADSLPGFGIVAAVLGIVITMQAIDGPVEEIGHKVGAALVGTFLGILLSYGLVAPLAAKLELLGEQEIAVLRSVAGAAAELVRESGPRDVVNRALRGLPSDCRPGHDQLRELLASGGS
ncbi:MAG: flagellar motor stator protein MotA [Gemmataceae bacterium]